MKLQFHQTLIPLIEKVFKVRFTDFIGKEGLSHADRNISTN
jgi:hypothetical protein